jgi:hypothetical protein
MSKKQKADFLRLLEYIFVSIWLYVFSNHLFMVLLGVFVFTLIAHHAKTKTFKPENFKTAAIYAIVIAALAMAGYCVFLFTWIDILSKILVKIATFIYWSILLA